MIGQQFALTYPQKLWALVLCSTGSVMDDKAKATLQERINLPKDGWGDPTQRARFEAAALYKKFYCARGDMENRIKEHQLASRDFAEKPVVDFEALRQGGSAVLEQTRDFSEESIFATLPVLRHSAAMEMLQAGVDR
jgi:hypothetical protein